MVPSKAVLRNLNPIAQNLYMWLCSYANETGNCFPSRTTLAFDVGCSDRTIDNMLELLIEKGLVKKTQRVHEGVNLTNYYTVIVGGVAKEVLHPPELASPGVAKEVRTELNLYITESSEDEDRPKRATYAETMGYDTKATDRLLKRSEEFIGHRWPALGKQKGQIAKILRAGYTEEQVWSCFEGLGDDEWWSEKGYDWATVASEIAKAKKKKQPIKSYGVKK